MLLILEQIGARHPLGGELARRAQIRVRGERIDDVAQRGAEPRAHRGRVADQRAQEQGRDHRQRERRPRRMADVVRVETRLQHESERREREARPRRQAGVAPDQHDRDANEKHEQRRQQQHLFDRSRQQIEQREIHRREHRQQDQIVTREVRVDLPHRQRNRQHDCRRDQHPREIAVDDDEPEDADRRRRECIARPCARVVAAEDR